MMRESNKLIKDSTFYAVSTVISQGIGIFTSIAMRRFLTPEMMGIWTTFLVVLNYALFAHMGVFTAIEVKIPYLRGKNQNAELQDMRNVAFTVAVILSAAITLILFAASFIFSHKWNADIILGVRLLALIVTATLFYNLYIAMLRADKGFLLLSKALVFNSLAMLIFISGFTYFLKLKGIYIATLFATAASWFYIQMKTKYSLKFHINIDAVKKLSAIGLPILVGGVVYTVLLSIDKIMIIKMMGPAQLGYYSIAVLALTYVHNFPKLLGIVIFPTMQEEYGKSNSRERILDYVKQPSLILAFILPATLAAAYFAMPILVKYVLPKYILGIDSMKILLLGCFFISLVPLSQNFLISVNKQLMLVPITSIAVAAGIGLNYFFIKAGYGIAGVALGTSLAYFLYFAVMFFYVLSHCEKSRKTLSYFMKICLPLVYAVVILLVLKQFVNSGSIVVDTLIQAPVFFIAYLPMIIYINKKTGILSNLFKKAAKTIPQEEMVFSEVPGEY